MPAIKIGFSEDRDRELVTFQITHQEVEKDFVRENGESNYPHGWQVKMVNLPEVRKGGKIFFIRGDNESHHDAEMTVPSDIFYELEDVIEDFNSRYAIWSQTTSLEEEFFSRIRA